MIKTKSDIGIATGFFYMHDGKKFLMTNRHVVRDEIKNIYPDSLSIRVHSNSTNLAQNDDLFIPLYNNEGNNLWLEHPRLARNVDIVALKINDVLKPSHLVTMINSQNFFPSDLVLGTGEDTMVLGFPMGFHDDIFNLPVLRSGTIATPYPAPFRGNPFFLIDARLHEGISGSPVFTKPRNMFRDTRGNTRIVTGNPFYFLGVVSAAFPPNFEPNPLGLNVVWFANLVQEIVNQ